jgi:opacity protein-like surface antigen
MRLKLTVILLLFFSIQSFSQDSKFSIDLNYPIAIGDNFLGQNYNGLFDVGANYKFSTNKIVDIGGSIHFGYFQNTKSNTTAINQLFEVKIFPIQPRIFAKFNIQNFKKLHPQIGLGYSILIYDAKANGIETSILPADINDNKSGFNFNAKLAYDLTNKFFIQVQYDFIKIGVENGITNNSYNTNINIIKFGFGYRI